MTAGVLPARPGPIVVRMPILMGLCLLSTLTWTEGLQARAQTIVDLPQEDRSLEIATEEVYRIGSLMGDEWETFSRVAGVAFDKDGNLYLLDAENFRVVKVGPEGDLVAEMGGQGGGPGEFGMPFNLAISREGRVAVFDFGHQGFTLFGPDGAFENTVPLGGGGQVSFPGQRLLAHPDGGVITAGGSVQLRIGAGGRPELPNTRVVTHYALSEEGGTETVYEGWNPATAGGTPEFQSSGGPGGHFAAPPERAFDPELLVDVLPDGRWAVVDSFTYEIKIGRLGQGPDTYLRRPISPREVTRRDREEEKQSRLAEMESQGAPRVVMMTSDGNTARMASEQAKQMHQDRIDGMVFAEEIPVVVGMAVDWGGRIWIERSGDRPGEDGPVDVIDSDGQYLGTVDPEPFDLPDAFGPSGLMAYIERDDLGVPMVVVKRVALR